jgi:hypothetical protein
MTATTASAHTTHITDITAATTTETTSIWRPGITAAIVAAAATTAVAAVAGALGVDFETAPGEAIPLLGFAQMTLIFSLVGVVMARLMAHRVSRPRSTFVGVTTALTVLSFVPDLTMSFDVTSTLTLMSTHVVAAAIVIPVLASRLAQRRSH